VPAVRRLQRIRGALAARCRDAPSSRDAPDSRAPPPAAIDPPAPPGERLLTDADRAEVRRLLQSARYATTDGQLIEPADRSALAFYDRALLIDPDNPEARYGIEGIVDRLIDQARVAAEQRRFDEAEQILARALLVDPGHQGVRPALTQIRLLETARRNVFRLDPQAVDARSATVLATLREAGQASRSPGCRAIIRARNDAEGRWMYQEMSASPGRDRIRAELLVAGTPSVENICFQGAE
jgi:tetratricopeptide (TPR) repeat protein